MDQDSLQAILQGLQDGRTPIEEGMRRLRHFPLLDLGHSRIDTQRELRCGFPEVVFGAGKTPDELEEIAGHLLEAHNKVLLTRLDEAGTKRLAERYPSLEFHRNAQAATFGLPPDGEGEGLVLVLSAGTADGRVATEAAITARMLGARVEELRDVGVAGLHRLLAHTARLREARSLVVVAGMEGALPSVVAGLVEAPVIAVPTSVGYGASLGGLAALLAMLNSCVAGVSVVNIDNGFGGGYAAALINRNKVSRVG